MTQDTLTQLIALADAHQAADEYRAGHYEWKDGGACAIGCTIRDAKAIGLVPRNVRLGDHAALARANGVPELAWRLCDRIFEGLPDDERTAWTPRFLRAIRADADYSHLPARIMARCAHKQAADAMTPEIKAVSGRVAALWDRRANGDEPQQAEWIAAQQQAGAMWQQAGAAWQQAQAAWFYTNAAWQQAGAAWHQSDAVRQQAWATWQQVGAVRENFWRWCGDMLCEELAR